MHSKKHTSGAVAGILLPMGLVCLFAFCALALALLGGRAYRGIQARVDDSHNSTVAAGYLRTKLEQNAHGAQVFLRDEGGLQVLVIAKQVNGTLYETRIFMYSGRLWETYETADAPFGTAGAMQIARLHSCTFSLSSDGLFSAMLVSPAGTVTQATHALGQGGAL